MIDYSRFFKTGIFTNLANIIVMTALVLGAITAVLYIFAPIFLSEILEFLNISCEPCLNKDQ